MHISRHGGMTHIHDHPGYTPPNAMHERPSAQSDDARPATYTTVAGESLALIAQRIYGNAGLWRRIYDANRESVDDPERLRPGQTLKIPMPTRSRPR